MSTFPHWFETNPALLEHEEYEYRSQGLNFALNEELFRTRQVVAFRGKVTVGERELALEVVYPPGYPFIRPEIYSWDTSLFRHQNPISKNLCVLPNEDDEWDWSTMSGPFMVRQALALLKDSFSGPEIVASNEVPAPEPQITWLGHLFSGALVIPEELQKLPEGSSGNFRLQALSLESQEPIRALLSWASVHEGSNTTTISAPDALQKVYQQGILLEGAWFKAKDLPDPASVGNFRLLRNWALGQKSLESLQRKNKKRRLGDFYNVEVIGIVATDEGPKRDESHDTWVVLVSWEDGNKQTHERVIRPAPLSEVDRFSRAPQLTGLSDKRIIIVGLGAVGSTVAIQLARAGIGYLHLIDYDVVQPANLTRHEVDLMDVGVEKTVALAARIAKVNPFTRLNSGTIQLGRLNGVGEDVYANSNHLQTLADYASKSHLVIAATGSGGLNHVLNRIGLYAERPVIFAWVTNGAWGGRVMRMIPRQTGCYECTARNPPNEEPNSDPEAIPVYARGCGYPSFTGAGFDIASISMLATRLAVQTILREESGGYPAAIFDHIVWQNRAELPGPFPQLSQFEALPQRGCTACGI